MAPSRTASPFDAHVTAGLCVLACGVTLLSWMGKDVSPLYLTSDAFFRQPWRIVTSVLPHANFRVDGFVGFFHIAFNVLMLLRFGRLIEARYATLLTALFYFVAAVVSSTAQFVWSEGGIGLSGVGYAVFGFLWVAGKRSADFADALDYGAVVTFVGWFFFCIAATHFGVMRIANVAHGAGAAIGGLIALFATARSSSSRIAFGALTAALTVVCVLLAAHRGDVHSALGI